MLSVPWWPTAHWGFWDWVQLARNIELVPLSIGFGCKIEGRWSMLTRVTVCIFIIQQSNLHVCTYPLSVGPQIKSYLLPGMELEHPSIMKYASKAIGSPLTSTFYNTEEHLKLLISIPSDFWHWITCWPMHAYPPAPWHHSEESPHPRKRWPTTCQPDQLAACHCSTLFHTSSLSPNASVQWDLQLLHYAGTSWSHVCFHKKSKTYTDGTWSLFSIRSSMRNY